VCDGSLCIHGHPPAVHTKARAQHLRAGRFAATVSAWSCQRRPASPHLHRCGVARCVPRCGWRGRAGALAGCSPRRGCGRGGGARPADAPKKKKKWSRRSRVKAAERQNRVEFARSRRQNCGRTGWNGRPVKQRLTPAETGRTRQNAPAISPATAAETGDSGRARRRPEEYGWNGVDVRQTSGRNGLECINGRPHDKGRSNTAHKATLVPRSCGRPHDILEKAAAPGTTRLGSPSAPMPKRPCPATAPGAASGQCQQDSAGSGRGCAQRDRRGWQAPRHCARARR